MQKVLKEGVLLVVPSLTYAIGVQHGEQSFEASNPGEWVDFGGDFLQAFIPLWLGFYFLDALRSFRRSFGA